MISNHRRKEDEPLPYGLCFLPSLYGMEPHRSSFSDTDAYTWMMTDSSYRDETTYHYAYAYLYAQVTILSTHCHLSGNMHTDMLAYTYGYYFINPLYQNNILAVYR